MSQMRPSQPQNSLISQQIARHIGGSSSVTFTGFSGDFTARERSHEITVTINEVPASPISVPGAGDEPEIELPIFSTNKGKGKEKPQTTIVQRGFHGVNIKPPDPCWNRRQPARYPPPRNCAYEHAIRERTEKIRPPKVERKESWDGAAFVTKYILDQQAAKAAKEVAIKQQAPNVPSLGQVMANKIDSVRLSFNQTDDEELIFPFDKPSLEEFRRDFARAIDKSIASGHNPMSKCGVCENRHIPPGPPNTLQFRDTCGSMLPKWFPGHTFLDPWDAFIQLFNDMVFLEEIDKGLRADPNWLNPWNKHFHNRSLIWKSLGREGGWWRCRTAKDEPNANVPAAETRCHICHNPNLANLERSLYPPWKKSTTPLMKQDLTNWIADAIAAGLKDDIGFVKGRARAERREFIEGNF